MDLIITPLQKQQTVENHQHSHIPISVDFFFNGTSTTLLKMKHTT